MNLKVPVSLHRKLLKLTEKRGTTLQRMLLDFIEDEVRKG